MKTFYFYRVLLLLVLNRSIVREWTCTWRGLKQQNEIAIRCHIIFFTNISGILFKMSLKNNIKKYFYICLPVFNGQDFPNHCITTIAVGPSTQYVPSDKARRRKKSAI